MIDKNQYNQFFTIAAKQCGVEYVGLTHLYAEPEFLHLENWLKDNKHGEMKYLNTNLHCRKDPRELLAGATVSAIFAMPYSEEKEVEKKYNPSIAKYARLKDYHKVLKKVGTEIFEKFQKTFGSEYIGRVLVDSAPVLERALAARAGEGFIGKNTLFIIPNKGSWFILFELFLTGDFEEQVVKVVNPKERSKKGGCGTCKRCQVYCPTGALNKDYILDARKCLSYLTIEFRGVIPIEYWIHLKDTIFGCDICQSVCPYNRFYKKPKDLKIHITKTMPLEDIAVMDQNYYVNNFGGTPVTRAKKNGLQRNALISMVVREHPKLEQVISFLQKEDNEIIQGTLKIIPKWHSLNQ